MPVEYIFKCLMCGWEAVGEASRECPRCGGPQTMKNYWYERMGEREERLPQEEEEKEKEEENDDGDE